eukprot:scaffold8916_cov122-Isochrysis_galbana.AAC.3
MRPRDVLQRQATLSRLAARPLFGPLSQAVTGSRIPQRRRPRCARRPRSTKSSQTEVKPMRRTAAAGRLRWPHEATAVGRRPLRVGAWCRYSRHG